ncbi:MAG: DUF6913 domain-containing protein [Mangrovibacterium sp.]
MDIRERLLNRWLRLELKRAKPREKCFVNINQAQTIGVIWQEGDVRVLDFLEKEARKRRIKVQKLCYSPEPREIAFTAKDFSFWGKPQNELITTFVAQKFDILFDVTRDVAQPIKVVRALSRAKFKVGSLIEDPEYLDLNIQVDSDVDSVFMAEQMLYYLEVINNK